MINEEAHKFSKDFFSKHPLPENGDISRDEGRSVLDAYEAVFGGFPPIQEVPCDGDGNTYYRVLLKALLDGKPIEPRPYDEEHPVDRMEPVR